jgi:hypothetical protein
MYLRMGSFPSQRTLQVTDAFQALIAGPLCTAIMGYVSAFHSADHLQQHLFFLTQQEKPGQSSNLYLMLQR